MISIKLNDVLPNTVIHSEHLDAKTTRYLEELVYKAINNIPTDAYMININLAVELQRMAPITKENSDVSNR